MEKITISKELLDRADDDKVVSRIPGRQHEYLYLDKENVLAMGEYAVLASIDVDKMYVIGGKDSNQPATVMRGENLLKWYTYNEKYDPILRGEKVDKDVDIMKKETPKPEAKAPANNVQPAKQIPQYPAPNHPFTKEQFRQIRLGEKHQVDVTKYWDIRLRAEQMKQLRLMLEDGVDIQHLGYASPDITVDKLEELRKTHKGGYAPNYNWKLMNAGQMREIRLGMEKGVQTTEYSWPAYGAEQMKQLRLGLQQEFDISGYKNPHFTAKQMYNLRCIQVWEKIKQQLSELWQAFKEAFHLNNLNKIHQHIKEQVTGGLDKAVRYMENPKTVKGMAPVDVPTETVDNRIQETIQDIKELLVSQELADEAILSDEKISQKMDERIRNALDELMAPENVQNPENQEAVIKEAVDNLLQDTGTEKVMQEQKESLAESSKQDITQNISTMKDVVQIWVDMDVEELGEVSAKTLMDVQKKGFSLAKENGVYKVVAPEPEVSQEIQQQAMELMEQAEQRQVANNIKLCK